MNRDFLDMLSALNEAEAEYVVVGPYGECESAVGEGLAPFRNRAVARPTPTGGWKISPLHRFGSRHGRAAVARAPAWYTNAMRFATHLLALVTLLSAGCALSQARAPRPESVQPGSAREGERTGVTIRGSDFFLQVQASYVDRERSYLYDTFTARLGEVDLEEVTYVDFNTLTAVVPETLPEGAHDLVVQDPEGRKGVLRDAFEVLPPAHTGDCDPENAAPDDATCDGVDDDCDGETDEDYASTPTSCGVGACEGNTGEVACADGVTEDSCDPFGGAAFDDTTCDGVDDDCDGETDEDFEAAATTCGQGGCAAEGELDCVDGELVNSCSAGDPAPGDTSCDGLDDDCDGSTDEEYTPTPTSCGAGECAGSTGNLVCSDGLEHDTCDPFQGVVNENQPSGNCLDAADNDCDGLTDGDDPSCGVVANTPPIAAIYVDPPAGTTAVTFQADADGSTDHEDDALSLIYLWDWDDDGVTDDEGLTSSHTFSSQGAHTVTLIVEDTGGLRGYATFEVIVVPSVDLITVTTELDEEDDAATPASPGGTGLSLREAIVYANDQAGKQSIYVPAGYVIDISDQFPESTDASGMDIVGDGAAIVGVGMNPNEDCLKLGSSNIRIYGLDISGCGGYAVQFTTGTNNRVARCRIHDNANSVFINGSGSFFGPDNVVYGTADVGVFVSGASTVEFNRIYGNASDGIFVGNAGSGAILVGNTSFQNGGGGVFVAGLASNVVLVHNTLHDNAENGVFVGANGSGLDFRNNILSQNGLYGIFAMESYFLYHDYNDYYLNPSGTCSGCTVSESNSLSDEPLYVDAVGFDFRLRGDSTLIDQAVVIPGVDLNRAEPGDHNGGAPDIGAWEAP